MKSVVSSFEYKLNDDNIDDIISYIKSNNEYINKSYILDISKDKFNLIEKCVYDIALYNLKEKNIEYNEEIHYIEFILKKTKDINKFDIECDKYEKQNNCVMKYPILSSILYLQGDIFPTLITNFDNDKLISFPIKNKVINFENMKYYSITNIFPEIKFDEQYIIMINVWDKKQSLCNNNNNNLNLNKKYNKNDECFHILKINNNITNIKIDSNLLYVDFYNNLIHSNERENKLLYSIGEEIKKVFGELLQNMNIDNSIINIIPYKFDLTKNNEKDEDVSNNNLLDNPNNYLEDYNNIKNKKISNENRFNQKLLLNNIFNSDICNWILKEMILLETEDEKDISYVKNIDNLPFFSFIITSLSKIIDKLTFFYNIKLINGNVNIKKILFSKQNNNNINNINNNDDFLNISILLNDTNEIIFKDNIKYKQNAGDAIIYCNLLTNYKQSLNIKKYSIDIIIEF